ncbi:MAG TPA: MATE family efflux transporter [Tepidisphaeraceae bacterium]|nr:MATE family efflux transporter [Tepidisphaeraceae bacterium]
MQTAPSLRRDIFSAYVVTVARVAAWIAVTATVFRVAGKSAFALLAVVQSTVGILEYAAIGLSPAIIRLTAEAMRQSLSPGISEHTSAPHRTPAVQAVYANGFVMALLTAAGGAVFLLGFMWFFQSTQTNRDSHGVASELVLMVGIATLIRLVSDAPGAALQTSGKIFLDNLLLTSHEVIWGLGTAFDLLVLHLPWQRATGFALVAGSLVLLAIRAVVSHHYGSGLFEHWWRRFNARLVRQLLIFGGMVVAAQMADYLYAPTDNLLILNLIDQATVAVYTPAVQIDGGALLLVGAVASVLLPRTALAHASGDPHLVRRYYVRGTLATFLLLLVAAPVLWLAAPFLFRLWLGNPMAATCAILPMMLIHTVVGGSSAVGRSILLAIGKVRPFTVSVLIAGVANVVLSYSFVRYGHMGLRGIVLGTIVAVTGRCAIWMPWYTLRVLSREIAPSDTPILESLPPAHLS